jgi:hypothetical protein
VVPSFAIRDLELHCPGGGLGRLLTASGTPGDRLPNLNFDANPLRLQLRGDAFSVQLRDLPA